MKKANGYYNEKVLAKFTAALKLANQEVKEILQRGEIPQVKFSNSNSKMGNVASVSSLPFITCPARCADTCGAACYAAKLANLRPAVLNAYAWNTAIAMQAPAEYFRQISEIRVSSALEYRKPHSVGWVI